jgi:DNA-binding response OmpR family regulator
VKNSTVHTSTILLVDDYPDTVEVMALYLRSEGFDVLTAGDGQAALSEAERARPDLIVMDLELPGLSGCEVARRLHASAATRRIPLIAATGHSHARQIEEAVDAGFDTVMVKPLDPSELVARIRGMLAQAT